MTDQLRIVDWRLELCGGHLPSAPGNAVRAWSERRGWLLSLIDSAGRIGLGEASSLPGYSPDTDVQTKSTLEHWLRGLPLGLDAQQPTLEDIASWLNELPATAPAARFAVETALLDLLGQRLAQPLAGLLGATPGPDPLRLAGLVTADQPEPALAEARAALDRGVRTVKVKVGRPGAFARELEVLALLRAELGEDTSLRLDANGQLPSEDLSHRLDALARFDPEFIEEPLSGVALAAIEYSPIPLAADETLQQSGAWDLLRPLAERGLLAAVVLKPMALGGAARCLELARLAAAQGVDAVVSHLFDGPVGLAAAKALARALPSPRLDAGLDAHSGLEVWPSFEPAAKGHGLGLKRSGGPK